jgi:hypothetical protein
LDTPWAGRLAPPFFGGFGDRMMTIEPDNMTKTAFQMQENARILIIRSKALMKKAVRVDASAEERWKESHLLWAQATNREDKNKANSLWFDGRELKLEALAYRKAADGFSYDAARMLLSAEHLIIMSKRRWMARSCKHDE